MKTTVSIDIDSLEKCENRARCMSNVLPAKSPYTSVALRVRGSVPNPSVYDQRPIQDFWKNTFELLGSPRLDSL